MENIGQGKLLWAWFNHDEIQAYALKQGPFMMQISSKTIKRTVIVYELPKQEIPGHVSAGKQLHNKGSAMFCEGFAYTFEQPQQL